MTSIFDVVRKDKEKKKGILENLFGPIGSEESPAMPKEKMKVPKELFDEFANSDDYTMELFLKRKGFNPEEYDLSDY